MKTPTLDIDKQLGAPDATGRMYRRVIANLLDHIQTNGFSIISVDDREEDTSATTIKDAMELIFNLDEAYIWIEHPKYKQRHYIFIVLGNEDPEDLICDWSFTNGDPDKFNKVMEIFKPEEHA